MWLFGQLWKLLLFNQTGEATFLKKIVKAGATFIPTSGHTGDNSGPVVMVGDS